MAAGVCSSSSSYACVVVGLVALLLVGGGQADTPANCTYESIRGYWTFSIGPGGHDKTVNCSVEFEPVDHYTVDLEYPDVATDKYGNRGFWTLIYNQGFEVVIAGRKFFAFSYYEMGPNNTVYNRCHNTFAGWSHLINESDWACYKGYKVESFEGAVIEGKVTESKVLSEEELKMPYKRDSKFVEALNKAQKSWVAVDYEEYEGKTVGDMLRRAGGVHSHKTNVFPPQFAASAQTSKKGTEKKISLPDSFDWRNVSGVNYVSPIRNQGDCGSCYTFASTAMYEARLRIITQNAQQTILSPQDIVSCSNYSQGCEGGFNYLNGKYGEDFGFVAESCFPYEGKDMPCETAPSCRENRLLATNYFYVGGFYGACSEIGMMEELVTNGPIAVSFMVYNDFMNYKSGVYVHNATADLVSYNPWQITNHAVLVVGYGFDESTNQPYWIVKNSWGTTWGIDGYFWILRGADECAIESMAVAFSPVIDPQ